MQEFESVFGKYESISLVLLMKNVVNMLYFDRVNQKPRKIFLKPFMLDYYRDIIASTDMIFQP